MVSIKKRIEIDVLKSELCGYLIRGDGKIICQEKLTVNLSECDLVKNVVWLINTLILHSSGYKFDIEGVHISCLGKVDQTRGIVQAQEFGIKNLALADSVADSVGLCVKVTESNRTEGRGEAEAVALS
ncbi:MAG: hypothetical protein ACI4MC_04650 [Candidatus Coproplasma sp.]